MVFLFPNNNFTVGKVPVFLKKNAKVFLKIFCCFKKCRATFFILLSRDKVLSRGYKKSSLSLIKPRLL